MTQYRLPKPHRLYQPISTPRQIEDLGFDRDPSMSHKLFAHLRRTLPENGRYREERDDYHNAETLKLNRRTAIAVGDLDQRCFYYNDRPFMALSPYRGHVHFDFHSALMAAKRKMVAKQTNAICQALGLNIQIEIGARRYGHPFVYKFHGVDPLQRVAIPTAQGVTFETVALAARRQDVEYFPERQRSYTQEDKGAVFWRASQGAI